MGSLLIEFRCDCGQLLFRGFLCDSFIEIKCRRCKKILPISNLYQNNTIENYSILYDSQGCVAHVQSSQPTILGYTHDELIGKSIGDIGLHVDNEQCENVWNKAHMVRFDPFIVETFQRHKDGSLVCVQERTRFQTIKDKNYVLISYEVIKKDIGVMYQPKHSSYDLEISGLIAEINIDGFFTYVSQAFAHELFYDSLDMLGKSFFKFCSQDVVPIFRHHFSRLRQVRKSFYVPNITLVKKNNAFISYNFSFITTYQKDNTLRGFVVVNTLAMSVDSAVHPDIF